MPVGVPQIAIDLGVFQAGDKPGPVIETVLRALTREQATLHAMPWNLARLDRSNGVSVQMHGALVTVLRPINLPTAKIVARQLSTTHEQDQAA